MPLLWLKILSVEVATLRNSIPFFSVCSSFNVNVSVSHVVMCLKKALLQFMFVLLCRNWKTLSDKEKAAQRYVSYSVGGNVLKEKICGTMQRD